MKNELITIAEIKLEIQGVSDDLSTKIKRDELGKNSPLVKRECKKIELKRKLILYLETKPLFETVKSEYDKLKKDTVRINDGFEIWFENNSQGGGLNNVKNVKKHYEKLMLLASKKQQLKNLGYLLKLNKI